MMIKEKEIWDLIVKRALEIVDKEPMLKGLMVKAILDRHNLKDALANFISERLQTSLVGRQELYQTCMQAFEQNTKIIEAAAYDLEAVALRDPAVSDILVPFLYLKGPHALQSWRVANWLWKKGRHDFARYFQSIISDTFGVDIHPAATIGKGIMFDHATGIVIGETCVIADNVSIMQDVTLGGTGKESGDRHPKIASGVMIGAGAKVLGNIKIGEGAKVGAGSVVLSDVEQHTTVAGIPAKVVGVPKDNMPSLDMDQNLDVTSDLCNLGCGKICTKIL